MSVSSHKAKFNKLCKTIGQLQRFAGSDPKVVAELIKLREEMYRGGELDDRKILQIDQTIEAGERERNRLSDLAELMTTSRINADGFRRTDRTHLVSRAPETIKAQAETSELGRLRNWERLQAARFMDRAERQETSDHPYDPLGDADPEDDDATMLPAKVGLTYIKLGMIAVRKK